MRNSTGLNTRKGLRAAPREKGGQPRQATRSIQDPHLKGWTTSLPNKVK